jgi:hypothetical protein
LALDGGGWSVPRPGHFTRGNNNVGGRVGTRAGFEGHAVAYLLEALRYKPAGRVFDSRWRHWNFLVTKSFRPHHGRVEVDSASNKNEYQEYFLVVKEVCAKG